MITLSLSLPDSLKDFVEEQAALDRYPTPGDYVRALLGEAQDCKDRAELERKLLAALDAEAVEMGPADWDRMRERLRKTVAKR